ncbi:unnamed protein product [Ilex paraguariensis]|uniref:DUF668 domain-containing protein n=1 Tax=Ilex paraguariensis TaxID=185542 RepID=A0ABC8S228_9AQUA
MPPNARDMLYQSLPPSIKYSLRSKLESFHVKEELTVTEIKAEMEKTLQWLVPIATNTAKSEANRKPAGPIEAILIETLHHADREKTESLILELVLWLNYLIGQSKAGAKDGGKRTPINSPLQEANQQPLQEAANALSPILSIEDQEMLQDVSNRKQRGISKSQDFDSPKNTLRKHDRLSKSSSHSPTRGSDEVISMKRHSSSILALNFGRDKEKALGVIDRDDTQM